MILDPEKRKKIQKLIKEIGMANMLEELIDYVAPANDKPKREHYESQLYSDLMDALYNYRMRYGDEVSDK